MTDLGGYRLGHQRASGGTASVYRAESPTGDTVALKVFAPGTDQQVVAREAAIGRRMAHHHAVRVLEVLDEPALVCEWADGGSLAELIADRGRLTAGEVVTVGAAVASFLEFIHEQRWVHSDLCASNIVFDGSGRPLVVDFGSARAESDVVSPVYLTPTDVAPEVAKGATPTAQADLFGLGSVLLHALTGQPAWSATDLQDVVVQATVGQWPDPEIGGPLGSLIRDLLEAEPARRPAATEVLRQLRRADSPAPVNLGVGQRREESTVPGRHSLPEHREAGAGAEPSTPRSWPDPRTVVTQLRSADQRPVVVPPTSPRWRRPRTLIAIGGLAAAVAATILFLPSTDTPGPVTGGVELSSAPASLAGSTTPVPTPSSPAPVTSQPQTISSATVTDWAAVVTELDELRSHALVTRDAEFLTLVYTADSELLAADRRTVEALRSADQRVPLATHEVLEVSWQGEDAQGRIRLVVRDRWPAHPILDPSGTEIGRTTARAAAETLMVLEPQAQGYLIFALGPVA